MKKLFRIIEVRIRYIIWAIQTLPEPSSYDRVKHSTGEYIIKYGNPHWVFVASHHGKQQFKESEFKVIRSRSRDWRRLKEKIRFQMTSWYSIDIRNPLFKRISYKNASNIYFHRKY